MNKVFEDAMTLIQEVPATLKDCGIDSYDKFRDASFEHLETLGFNDQCLTDVAKLGDDVMDIVKMVESGNMNMA